MKKKKKHLAFSQRSDMERLQQTEQVFFLSCVFLTAAAVACTHAKHARKKTHTYDTCSNFHHRWNTPTAEICQTTEKKGGLHNKIIH